MPIRMGILTTHPIQYQIPWFRAVAADPRFHLEVLFCDRGSASEQARAGFEVPFEWDVPLFEGYPHRMLRNVARHPSVSTFSGLDTPDLEGVLKSLSLDVLLIHGWYYKAAWQAVRAARRLRLPLIVRSDSHRGRQSSAVRQILKRVIYPRLFRMFDVVAPVGTRSADYFRAFGVPLDRIVAVPHVIDLTRFSDGAERLAADRDALRARFGIAREAFVALLCGKLIAEKRPFDFLRAIERSNGAIEGLIVGDGPLRVDLEREVRARSLPVRFAGFMNQSEIVQSYVASDVLVLPSDRESWGMVVNESIAAGTRVIVSDAVGCAPDLVNAMTGQTYPVGDLAALTARLLDEATRTGRRPESLRSFARVEFRPAVAVDALYRAAERSVRAA